MRFFHREYDSDQKWDPDLSNLDLKFSTRLWFFIFNHTLIGKFLPDPD